MKRLRVAAAFMAMVMTLSMAAGCKPKEKELPQNDTAKTATGEVKINTSEVTDLSIWIFGDPTYKGNAKEDIVLDEVIKKTGIRFKQENIIYSTNQLGDEQRFNLLYASNSIPDLIYGGTGNKTQPVINKLDENGFLYHFTEEQLKKYTPDLYGFTSDLARQIERLPDGNYRYVQLWNQSANESALKKYPEWAKYVFNANNSLNNQGVCLFRDDILKEFFPKAKSYNELEEIVKTKGKLTWEDIYIPELYTQDGFFDYLYKVKAKYGDKVTPLFEKMPPETTFLTWPDYAFFDPISLEVKSTLDDRAAYTKLAQRYNKAYRDGIIEKNFAIVKGDQLKEAIGKGKYAVLGTTFATSAVGQNRTMVQVGHTARFRQVPLNYENGGPNVIKGYAGLNSGWTGHALMINKKKVKEDLVPKILNYINFFSTDEGLKLMAWGPQSSGLWEETNGKRKWKDAEFEAVVKGEKPKGVIKDYDYYGIAAPGSVTDYKEFYFMPFTNNFNPYTPTTVTITVDRAVNEVLIDKFVKGYYDFTFFAWNGNHPTNSAFWGNKSKGDDAKKKAMAAVSDKEFEAAMTELWNAVDKQMEYPKLKEEQQKEFIEWLKKNKDKMKFHPEAKLDKLK